MLAGLFVCVVLLLFAAFLYYALQRIVFKEIDKLPGARIIPLLGHGALFGTDVNYYFQRGMEYQKKYGPVAKVWPPWFRPYVMLADADMIEFITSSMKYIDKTEAYSYFHPWLGTGLLTSTGEKWQKRRKMITPAFHFKVLEQFVDVFDSIGNIMIEKLAKEVEKDSTNIYQYVNNCALDIICETAMGTSVNAQQSTDSKYIKAVKGFLQIVIRRDFSPVRGFDWFFRWTEDFGKQKEMVTTLHDFTDSVIMKRRENIVSNNEKDNDEQTLYYKKKVAFLDLLLKSTIDGKPLGNEDIREEVDTFMFEGHDTITSTISFALYQIAQYPEVQEKIVQELNTIFHGKMDAPITYNSLQEMEYLQLVIKETLRLFPPVAIFQRQLKEPAKSGPYNFPSGTNLVINVYGMQRLPEHFPNPEAFIPERFTQENSKGRHPFCYIPFSAGPRNCIGQKFAMLEMKAAIAKIVRNYKLSPVPGHKLDLFTDSILKSLTGIVVKLDAR